MLPPLTLKPIADPRSMASSVGVAVLLSLSPAPTPTNRLRLLNVSPKTAASFKVPLAAPGRFELPVETLLSGGNLSATTTERIYVADVAISHIVDGRMRVFNATNGKLLGIINTGYAGNFALSAKADELYLATTYLSRGGRGERSDILEVWDTNTLSVKYEVLLPPKRAQALNYRGYLRTSADGRLMFVQNATPATSVTAPETPTSSKRRCD